MKISVVALVPLFGGALAFPVDHDSNEVKRDESTLGGCPITAKSLTAALEGVTPLKLAECIDSSTKSSRIRTKREETPKDPVSEVDIEKALSGTTLEAFSTKFVDCINEAKKKPPMSKRKVSTNQLLARQEPLVAGAAGDLVASVVSGLQQLLDKVLESLEGGSDGGSDPVASVVGGVQELLDNILAALQGGSGSSDSKSEGSKGASPFSGDSGSSSGSSPASTPASSPASSPANSPASSSGGNSGGSPGSNVGQLLAKVLTAKQILKALTASFVKGNLLGSIGRRDENAGSILQKMTQILESVAKEIPELAPHNKKLAEAIEGIHKVAKDKKL